MTALSMAVSTIVLAITDVFGGGGGGGGGERGGSPPKDERDENKWLNRLADALKRLVLLKHGPLSWDFF